MEAKPQLKLYFSDYFGFSKKDLDKYGAFDIYLGADLPLFIDPFLLFQSQKPEYKAQHLLIIRYLEYLKRISLQGSIDEGRLKSLFYFSEIKENYLGFAFMGNEGRGLGSKFAKALNSNLGNIFSEFGEEIITKDKHLEKLCLITRGVGRDMISDFATNLIKDFLLKYTEKFTVEHIKEEQRANFNISRVRFDYNLGVWASGSYILPVYKNDFVILTPKDVLTREENWISRADYVSDFFAIVDARENAQLRSDLDNYFREILSGKTSREELERAIERFTRLHPELIDYFIRRKENNGEKAVERSVLYVNESEDIFIDRVKQLTQILSDKTLFYQTGFNSKAETLQRIVFMKEAIENQGCWKIFYRDGKPFPREEDVHVLFKLVWFGTAFDVSSEVDDGRGPVDFKISYGKDKTLVEFKLAKNSHLRENLLSQLEIYKKASRAEYGYKVIVYFSNDELERAKSIIHSLDMDGDENIIFIDARSKVSASLAKSAE